MLLNLVQFFTGYRERGVGLYQALMELNFDSPSQIPENYTLEDRLALFEQFWDSSAPRFGDQGAVGWQNVLRNKTASMVEGSTATQVGDEDQLIAEAGGRVEEAKLWLSLELYRYASNIHVVHFQCNIINYGLYLFTYIMLVILLHCILVR